MTQAKNPGGILTFYINLNSNRIQHINHTLYNIPRSFPSTPQDKLAQPKAPIWPKQIWLKSGKAKLALIC